MQKTAETIPPIVFTVHPRPYVFCALKTTLSKLKILHAYNLLRLATHYIRGSSLHHKAYANESKEQRKE